MPQITLTLTDTEAASASRREAVPEIDAQQEA